MQPMTVSANDPFDLLGLEARFDLDPAALQRAYLARAALVHPDRDRSAPRTHARPGVPATTGEPASARLNEARQTLADPEKRAHALLRRLAGSPLPPDRSMPDGFLAEMLETRERMEADRARGPAAMDAWHAWAEQRRRGHLQRVAALFAGMASPPAADALAALRRELNAWRYTERLIEQIDDPLAPS